MLGTITNISCGKIVMSGEILVASVDDKSGTPLKCSKSTVRYRSPNSAKAIHSVSPLFTKNLITSTLHSASTSSGSHWLQAVAEGGGNVERRTAPSRPLSTTVARGRSSGGGAGQMWRRRWAKPRALAPLPLSRPEPDRSGSWVARSRLGSPDLAVDGDGGLVSLPRRWRARRLVGKEATTAAGRRALPLAPQRGLPTSRVLFFRPRTGGKHWTQLHFGGPGSKRGVWLSPLPTWEGEAERKPKRTKSS